MKRKIMNDKPQQTEPREPPEQPASSESGALIEPSDEAVVRREGSHRGGGATARVSDGRRAHPTGAGDRVAMAGRRRTGERGREVDGLTARLLPDTRRVRGGDHRRDQEGVSPSRKAVPPRS